MMQLLSWQVECSPPLPLEQRMINLLLHKEGGHLDAPSHTGKLPAYIMTCTDRLMSLLRRRPDTTRRPARMGEEAAECSCGNSSHARSAATHHANAHV